VTGYVIVFRQAREGEIKRRLQAVAPSELLHFSSGPTACPPRGCVAGGALPTLRFRDGSVRKQRRLIGNLEQLSRQLRDLR